MNLQHQNDDYCVLGSKLKSQSLFSSATGRKEGTFASPIVWDNINSADKAINRLVMSSSLASILSRASIPMGSTTKKPSKTIASNKQRSDESFISGRASYVSLIPASGADDESSSSSSSASFRERATIKETILSSHENWAIMPRLQEQSNSANTTSTTTFEKKKLQQSTSLVCQLLAIPSRKRRTYYPSLSNINNNNNNNNGGSNKRQRRFPKAA